MARSNEPENIILDHLDVHQWSQGNPREAIQGLFDHVVGAARHAIRWYETNKGTKASWSQRIRWVAIGLSILGGLAPLTVGLVGTGWQSGLSQAGYVLIALAAGLVMADRFFGVSSAWMRYLTTLQVLERQLADFRLEWASMLLRFRDTEPTTENVQEFLSRARTYLGTVLQLVEKETETWVAEFRTNLVELEKLVAQQKEAGRKAAEEIEKTQKAAEEGRRAQEKAGALNVNVAVVPANASVEGPITIRLDDKEAFTRDARSFALTEVTPGLHAVSASAKIGGRQVQSSTSVEVKPGQIATVNLSLGA